MIKNHKNIKFKTKGFVNHKYSKSYEFYARNNCLNIYFGWFNSPFGEALLMTNEIGLCGLAFSSEFGQKIVLEDMKKRWPNSIFFENKEKVYKLCKVIFSGSGEFFLYLFGTSFQVKVWKELLEIPESETKSYSEIASNIGLPNATRAVATAIGLNPISWLIPCHRVLRKSGTLGGYHWGISVKEKILNYEKFLT